MSVTSIPQLDAATAALARLARAVEAVALCQAQAIQLQAEGTYNPNVVAGVRRAYSQQFPADEAPAPTSQE